MTRQLWFVCHLIRMLIIVPIALCIDDLTKKNNNIKTKETYEFTVLLI